MKPIIFTPQNIRAILDGTKTQTRRIIKPQPNIDVRDICYLSAYNEWCFAAHEGNSVYIKSPFNKSDRLWVRESWGVWGFGEVQEIAYKADPKWHGCGTHWKSIYWKSPILISRFSRYLSSLPPKHSPHLIP